MLAGVLHSMHTIWISRNAVRFNNANISVHAAIAKVRSSISLNTSFCKAQVWPSSIGANILADLNISPIFKSHPSIKMVLWQPPLRPWIKVNTDELLNGNVAACGGIFRDSLAGFLNAYSSPLQVPSMLHTELLGIIISIEQAHIKGWSRR